MTGHEATAMPQVTKGHEPVPDLDLCPTIWCPVEGCDGYAGCDGTSWFCDSCGSTWDSRGERGERPIDEEAERV